MATGPAHAAAGQDADRDTGHAHSAQGIVMSTFVYAMLQNRRREQARNAEVFRAQLLADGLPGAPPAAETDQQANAGNKYLEAMAAMVPAEVLSLHALVLTFTTQTTDGNAVITERDTLKVAFWGLIALSALLYLVARAHEEIKRLPAGTRWSGFGAAFTASDWMRAAIPPLAFVVWTMLERTTAFDAAFTLSDADRNVAAVFLAVLLGTAATWLAGKQPTPPPDV